MGPFFNHYSLLIVSFGLAELAALILLTNKPKWNDYLAFGVIGFEFTPTFILFDASGHPVWPTVSTFDPQEVRDSPQ